jgi:hypothetical protein
VEKHTPDESVFMRAPEPHCRSCAVYARAIETLNAANVPFLVGGGFAVEVFVDAPRAKIKDLDLFIRPMDVGTALQALARNGFVTRLHEPQWLAKAFDGEDFVDLIYATRNGLLNVDDQSFVDAPRREVLGHDVLVQPVEEVIATKVFVTARDRFDVSDISHLVLLWGDRLDWRRLIERMSAQIEMLHVHLLLFQYIYPGQRARVPAWVYEEVERRAKTSRARGYPEKASRGLALDPIAFAIDIERWGFFDASRAEQTRPELPVESPKDERVAVEAEAGTEASAGAADDRRQEVA